MLEKVLQLVMLYDFYGALLTEKQQFCMTSHYIEDLSLGEISEQLGISRQAVHDILKRSEQGLLQYEEKLGLAEKYTQETRQLQAIEEKLKRISDHCAGRSEYEQQEIENLKQLFINLMDNRKGG